MTILDFGYFTLKDNLWIENQRYAGKIASSAFKIMEKEIKPGIDTLLLNDIIEAYLLDNNCIPTFKNFEGFPAACCVSINNEVVHGIPSKRILQDGDVIKVDSGATYNGAIVDMARTYVVGESSSQIKLLIDTTKDALYNAINLIKPNKTKLGDIGFAIKKTAAKINAKIVTDLGGHSLEYDKPHWFPFVPNIGEQNTGLLLRDGMTLCIEPMFTYGSPKIKILDDGWTVCLEQIGTHFEDTIFIHNDSIEIMTNQ